MKRIYRIVTYLIFFVILPNYSLHGLEVFNLFEISSGLHFLKDPRFAASYQLGYFVTEGVEIATGDGFHFGLSGTVSGTAPSEINLGVLYRGFASIGGKLHAGYIPARIKFSPVTIGILGSVWGEYARYSDTDLFFFYLSAGLEPVLFYEVADKVGVRIGLPGQILFPRRAILSYLYRSIRCFASRLIKGYIYPEGANGSYLPVGTISNITHFCRVFL